MDRDTPKDAFPLEPRRLFQRVLGAWASDLLELRRKGLDRPSRRFEGQGLAIRPLAITRDARRRAA